MLILWDDYDPNFATWEEVEELKNHYPLFNLKDKIVVQGDRNVMKNGVLVKESTEGKQCGLARHVSA